VKGTAQPGVSSGSRRAVLVDEHPLWLDAVEQVLQRVQVEVVGKASTFDQAIRWIEELQPEILVAEISLSNSEEDGLTWLLEIRRRFDDIKIIVLSVSDDASVIDAVLAMGAVAYVVKRAHPDDLAVAVRQSYEHSIYLANSKSHIGRVPINGQLEQMDLTRRELEILKLVAEGLSNAELAKMLWVTEQTVKFHLSNVYRKLNVSNRTEASRWAQLNGLLPAQPLQAPTT
jgi:DNA-binding NarL/FixJ family response regulator